MNIISNYNDEQFPLAIDYVLNNMRKIKADIDAQLNNKIPVSHYFNFDGKWFNRNTESFKKYKWNSDNLAYKDHEIKGVYVFAEITKDQIKPVYVGISKTIMRRIYQHAYSKRHETATLAYIMARDLWETEHKEKYSGLRGEFPLDHYMERIHHLMRTWALAIVEIDNNFELALAEQYLAIEYKPHWNSFETH